ncbi:MAG: TolC family protein [Arachidicoccus sp.]|nr:TolC family protein [Arachidicoccus sp.]
MNKSLFSIFLLASFFTEVCAQQALSLKDCIAYGLKNHISVRIYNNNIEQSKQKATESLSSYLPQVSINGSVDRNLKVQSNVLSMTSADGSAIPGFPAGGDLIIKMGTPYAAGITGELNQTIYDQAKLVGIKASEPNKQLSQMNKAQNDESLIYNITATYFQVIVLQKQLELQTDERERYKKLLDISQLRFNQGVAKKSDLMQVQVNLNNVISQIATTENNLSYSYNVLKNYMGLPQSASLTLSDTARWLQFTPEPNPYIPQYNYSNTTTYLQQQAQISLYDFNRKNIKAGALPSLSFYARYGANGFGSNFGDAFGKFYDYSAIGLKLNWNIFTGLKRSAQYKEASIDYENAINNLKLNESNQSLQFQNSIVSLQRTDSAISVNRDNMELAREVYSNNQLAYQQGTADLSALLNAENSYRDAQNNYLQSLLDYYKAQLDLNKSAGALKKYFDEL